MNSTYKFTLKKEPKMMKTFERLNTEEIF